MASWGICALVKAPTDNVLAFVAHHLEMGASQIFVYFDDPDDRTADLLKKMPGIVVTRCRAAFWKRHAGKRPQPVGRRQRVIVKEAYRLCRVDWLLHIDADEFLVSDEPISTLLDQCPENQLTVRLQPFEALPGDTPKGDRIYRSLHFRSVITDADLLVKLFGPFAPALHEGLVSHRLGKSFFRTDVPDLIPSVHFAQINEITMESQEFHPKMRHLHFHADDVDHWVSSAHRKATNGGVRFNPPYANQLLALDQAGLRDFHHRVHACDAATLDLLRAHGVLISTDLGLEEKVARLRKSIAKSAARKARPIPRIKAWLRRITRRGRKSS